MRQWRIAWPFRSNRSLKSVSEMIGEICRELAVLVLVFVPLELYRNSGISGHVIAVAIAGSIVLAAIGILIEWVRNI